jgi:hypothetical protein
MHGSAAQDILSLVHVQTKQFADKDNADLFAEEAAAQREVSWICQCADIIRLKCWMQLLLWHNIGALHSG